MFKIKIQVLTFCQSCKGYEACNKSCKDDKRLRYCAKKNMKEW